MIFKWFRLWVMATPVMIESFCKIDFGDGFKFETCGIYFKASDAVRGEAFEKESLMTSIQGSIS